MKASMWNQRQKKIKNKNKRKINKENCIGSLSVKKWPMQADSRWMVNAEETKVKPELFFSVFWVNLLSELLVLVWLHGKWNSLWIHIDWMLTNKLFKLNKFSRKRHRMRLDYCVAFRDSCGNLNRYDVPNDWKKKKKNWRKRKR